MSSCQVDGHNVATSVPIGRERSFSCLLSLCSAAAVWVGLKDTLEKVNNKEMRGRRGAKTLSHREERSININNIVMLFPFIFPIILPQLVQSL